MTWIQRIYRIFVCRGPLLPGRRGSDEQTPAIINLFVIMGPILVILDGPYSTLCAIGLAVYGLALMAKFVFNYAASSEPTASGRLRRALWVMTYHPITGRPYSAWKAVVRAKDPRSRALGLMYASSFVTLIYLLSATFPLS